MGLANHAGAIVVLVILTLWLQCAGMAILIHWAKTFIDESPRKLSAWRSALLMVRFAGATIILHVLEIVIWAGFYRWRCFPSWSTSFYFSATSFTTVGYGDVLLPQIWHAVGPIESLTGVVMCGMSVSGLFAILVRILAREPGFGGPVT